nr:hypothetical protein GCM10020093_045690 [Planobispora longispora]
MNRPGVKLPGVKLPGVKLPGVSVTAVGAPRLRVTRIGLRGPDLTRVALPRLPVAGKGVGRVGLCGNGLAGVGHGHSGRRVLPGTAGRRRRVSARLGQQQVGLLGGETVRGLAPEQAGEHLVHLRGPGRNRAPR